MLKTKVQSSAKMDLNSKKRRKVLRCIRCGRSLYHWNYLYSEYEEGYVCADDRMCRRPVITKRMKRLQEIKGRWVE